MPCSEKRARLLLERNRARVHKLMPFTIRLVDRDLSESVLQPVAIKLDPGSKTTGIAVVVEVDNNQHVLSLMELQHRGKQISEALTSRRNMRRRRRGNLRYRPARFNNRVRANGFQTGDMIKAILGSGVHAGTWVGRVAVRASGSFNIQTAESVRQGISWKYCQVIQRADGYGYSTTQTKKGAGSSPYLKVGVSPAGIR
jgi:hypothetical protein